MATFHTIVFTIHLTAVFLAQNLFVLAQLDLMNTQSQVLFEAVTAGTSLKVHLQSSESRKLIEGGTDIQFEVTISFHSPTDEQRQSEFHEYCNYAEKLKNSVLYKGEETFLNCTNVTQIVESNHTCNSTDGINCISNTTTTNSTLFSGNFTSQNITNINNITEIVNKVYHNITSLHCVNSTTPLVSYKPTILPPGYFNLTYETLEIDVELPSEFDINSVEELRLTNDFSNVTSNCTEYVVNSTYAKHANKPSIKLFVQFSNISWNGSMVIYSSVSERVVPMQLLNISGNVQFSGDNKELWIGSFTVPGLQFESLYVTSTNFPETPRTLLTDEEEIILNAKFIVPSVTTDIEVFLQLPIYNGSIPLKIISAHVGSMHNNIQSPNLRSGSGIGNNIVLTEVKSLNPGAPTLVSFKFGKTVTSPSTLEKSVVLSVTGLTDATGRHDVYVPGTFGNITSWLIYTTALGHKTIQSPQLVETELGEPQVKHDMSFEKDDGKIEGGLKITSRFQFYNPTFATEGVDVNLDLSFASEHVALISFDVKVCSVPVDTPTYCVNTWPFFIISNTSTSLNVHMTNLTAGFGVFGSAVGVILVSVPASETLTNEVSMRYTRDRWSTVSDALRLSVKIQSITISSQILSSSLDSTSSQNSAIGEKFTCRINGAIPVTTNEDFVVVIGSDSSVSYGRATLIHVGENLAGNGFHEGMSLNVTSGVTPYMGSSPVFFGQFGTVTSNGNSTQASASTFIVEMTFYVKDINTNTNGKSILLQSKVYHNPSYRNYRSSLNFRVVEPAFVASVVVSPSKDVNQNAELSFTATIRRSSVSTSTAFNMIVLLAVPSPHLILHADSLTGTLRAVPGSQSPIQFLSPDDINSTVIIYENDAVSQSTTEIRYKARTSSTLPPSIFITPSFVMSYTSLPKSLNQSLAREYSYGPKSEPTILIFRPDPFLNFSFLSHNKGKFDSGDILNYTIALKNIGVGNVKPTAYTVKVVLPLSKTLFKDLLIVCNQGSLNKVVTSERETIEIQSGTFNFGEEIKCDVKTTLNIVVPSQIIELRSTLTYHCLPTAHQHEYEEYNSQDRNEIHIKELSMQFSATGSTSQVLCGDILEYNMRIILPEVTTSLGVDYKIPTIPSNARGRRSVRRKRATPINILQPDSTQTSYTNGGNLVIPSMTISQVDETYTLTFPSVTNQPDNVNSENDVLTVQVKFLVANEPVIFSGRSFEIESTVHYPGGFVSQTATLSVVGPLVKPLLQLAKSFQVLDSSLDSPSGIFYVNVSHTSSSQYDAYDVNITDFIEGMNVIRDNEFPGVQISAPTNNVYKFSSNIPVIAVGETVHFYYKSKFKTTVKTPRYIRKSASVTWRSPQLNSPSYGPELNSDACVARNDTIQERDEPLYGFLALGAFLGLLIGFLMILMIVCIFIKCCRRGRLVPYYRVLTGKTTYTALEEEESEDKSFITPTNTASTSVHQTESVIYIISSDDPKKTENELENLDIQATKSLDRRMEHGRQAMCIAAFERVLKNLRHKRDISEDQVKMYTRKLHARLEEITVRNRQEYNKRSTDLQRKMQLKGEIEMKKLDERKQEEIEEAKAKLDGADKKKTKEILSLIVAHYQSLENEVRAQVQLEHDVEQEKIKKELAVNSRLSSKEAQGSLMKEMITEARINEEEAGTIISEHLDAIATIEKIHDDEKSRQVMALEMRLEERKALAQRMREKQEQEALVLKAMKEKYDGALENLVTSSQVSEAEASAYREKLFKDVDSLDKKLEKQRSKQEQNLHDRLTLLKKKKMQEKEDEYKLEMKKLDETSNDSESPKDVIIARHELTQKHNEEIHELERELDKNAAEELKELRGQYAEEARGEYKNKIEKYYKELMKKGAMEEDYNQLLASHDQDVAKILENQQAQQNKQKIALEEKLSKRRELLTEKMKAEQKEQEQIRDEEQKILKNMIDNQVVISEEEKEKIMREHEQNMAELESSLTLNKLRQKQMLEEKLEKRRKMKMEKLQQKHENENKRIKIENVDGATEEVDLLKKQEIEKQELMENNANMENEIEQIREEMLNVRMEALQEHNDRLGALITDLQIKRANQIAEINKQQRALGQLQTSILDDLDEKGVLVDPETKEILQQHQEQSQKLEKILQTQRDQQEKALKERLREKLKQKEQRLMQEQKDEIAKYIDNLGDDNALMKFRKTALKARHKVQLDQEKQHIEKEIEQSVNELKLQLELNRLKAVEKQSIQFISALVKCGKIQEDELDSVLQVLFPTKKPEEIDELLAQIYGPSHTRSSALALHSSKPSSLEMKVIAQISPMPSAKRKVKPRFEKPGDLDALPPPEVASNLPPVILQGSKGFNLHNRLQNDSSNDRSDVKKPLGRVRLAPLDKN